MSRARIGIDATITVLGTLVVAMGAYAGALLDTHPAPIASMSPNPSPHAAPTPTSPNPRPGYAVGFIPVDADLLNPSTGWTLLTSCARPGVESCHYVVAATTDGGESWSRPIQIGPSFAPWDGSAPRNVRLITPLDGFVWGLSGAYETHDGAKTWDKVALPGYFVYDIALGGDLVWALTSPCPKGTTTCSLEVRSSHDAGRNWSAPHALPRGFSPDYQVGFGSGVIMSSVPFGDVHMTSDGGLTWRTIKSPCKGSPFRGLISTPDGHELWELCVGFPDPSGDAADKVLYVSEDGGAGWLQKATSQSGGPLLALGIIVSLVSNRAGVVFVSGNRASLMTRDGGANWKAVPSDGPPFVVIRFSGQDNGYALDSFRNLWTTGDGGDHWRQLPPLAAPSSHS